MIISIHPWKNGLYVVTVGGQIVTPPLTLTVARGVARRWRL